jgi:hypothetical protein
MRSACRQAGMSVCAGRMSAAAAVLEGSARAHLEHAQVSVCSSVVHGAPAMLVLDCELGASGHELLRLRSTQQFVFKAVVAGCCCCHRVSCCA